jgi:hypothetical protein
VADLSTGRSQTAEWPLPFCPPAVAVPLAGRSRFGWPAAAD